MIRLNLVVEGQSEEIFCRDVLAIALGHSNISVNARCVRTSKSQKGGVVSFAKMKRDIDDWRLEDQNPEARFTTMLDLFRLPTDFPGYEDSLRLSDPYGRTALLEDKFGLAVGDPRFLPNILVHEFEALLFSNVEAFAADFIDRPKDIAKLKSIRDQFGNPELINTKHPPSYRIKAVLPDYKKTTNGPKIAGAIGLDCIRSSCPHFDQWLSRIEGLH